MHVRMIDTMVELYELRDAWRSLSASSVLLSWEWLVSWWEAYGGDDQLFLLACANEQGDLQAIAPWFLDSRFDGQTIRCLGSGDACTDYMRVLVADRANGVACFAAIAGYLDRALNRELDSRFSDVHTLELDGVRRDAKWWKAFETEMLAVGFRTSQRPLESTWVLSLEGGWPGILQRMSSSWRRKAKKSAKRIDSGEITVRTCETDSSFEIAYAIFEELHQKRRKSLSQPGCFADPQFCRFLREASNRLLPDGRVRVQWCERAGHPIAAQFQLITKSTVQMYQSGVDPDHLDVEPGHTMLAGAIRGAIDEGFQRFDFLRGDERYKSGWGAVASPLTRIALTPPKASARVRRRIIDSARQVRDLARSLRKK